MTRCRAHQSPQHRIRRNAQLLASIVYRWQASQAFVEYVARPTRAYLPSAGEKPSSKALAQPAGFLRAAAGMVKSGAQMADAI